MLWSIYVVLWGLEVGGRKMEVEGWRLMKDRGFGVVDCREECGGGNDVTARLVYFAF